MRIIETLRTRNSSWFRPEVLLAFALLVCTLGVGVYVQSKLTQVEEGLPLEVLMQQSDGAFLTRELSELKVAAEAARRSPSSAEVSNLRRVVESSDRKIARAVRSHEFSYPLGISAMFAVIGPALADTKRWITDGLYGQPANSAAVIELIDLRISDAYRQILVLNDQANERALELLQEQAGKVDRLRQSLLLILILIAVLALALVFFVARERKANAQAQVARTQLREGIDSLSGGFALFDRDERLVLCNSGYAQVFPRLGQSLRRGVRFEELLRQALSRGSLFEAPADPEAWIETRLAHFRSGGGSMETRTCDKRWHRIAERRTGDGGVVAITSDITELREVGEQLSEKNRMLDIALANMAQGLALFDAEDRLVISNQRFAELLDLPSELARSGTAMEDIVRHGVRQAGVVQAGNVEETTRRRLESARRCDKLWHREILADGKVVEVYHRPLASGGSLATYEDVSRQFQAERDLHSAKDAAEIANRAKSEFLANIGHELRTPLNAIIGFSDIISREMFGPIGSPSYRSYAKDIHDSGTQLLSVINDILELSNVEAGRLALKDKHLDLAKAVQPVLRKTKRRASAAKIRLEVDIPAALPLLRADPRALQQIVFNILTNAIKFTPAGGSIVISAEHREREGLVLTVRDSGIGIAAEDIGTALAPFGQLESAHQRSHGGTGLGLPLSRHLVDLHEGELTIESTSGQGTAVHIRFPPDRLAPVRQETQKV